MFLGALSSLSFRSLLARSASSSSTGSGLGPSADDARSLETGPRADADADADDFAGFGWCGWFQSSYELATGLELLETDWIDAELPAHLACALEFA